MSAGDWYRNKSWNDEIEANFFAKLSRSRSGRDQYLVIQALTLSEIEPNITIRLAQLFFETRVNDFDDVRAHFAIAAAHKKLGRLEAAIESYKAVLKRESELPKHRTNTYVELPYLVATMALKEHYECAMTLLSNGLRPNTFPVDKFKHFAANALILSEQGSHESASLHAHGALNAANIKKSGFEYHQTVGLVGDQHASIIKKLLRLID